MTSSPRFLRHEMADRPMGRRWPSLLRNTGSLLLAPLLTQPAAVSAAASPEPAGSPPRPNVVFIMADDLGYGDLGCYGQPQIRTPNIDRMAAEGVRFTQFYTGSPVCAPARNTLMTGQHCGHTLIRGNAKIDLRPQDVTVAEVLKRGGYATGLSGKWGLGREGSIGAPTRKGFDFFFGYIDQTMAHNYYPAFLVRNETRVPLRNVVPNPGPYNQGVATRKVDYSADLMADEVVRFVREHRDRPFFLYFAPTLPHANNEAKPDGMEVPDYGPYSDKDWPAPQKGYAAMVTRLDAQVGRLLGELEKLGLDEKTVVFFTSDNGPHAEGGNDPAFFRSGGGLRGKKRDLYEGGIRVPMIVRWPGRAPAGVTSQYIGYLPDMMPTLSELAGVPPAPHHDGVSFVATITGKPAAQRKHEFLYWEFYENGWPQAVRIGDWKAVRKPMQTGPVELYDLSRDAAEEHDVAGEHPDLVARVRECMSQAHEPSELWKVGEPAPSPAAAAAVPR